MSAVELLAAALEPLPVPVAPIDGTCCVLGTREPCIPREHAIRPRFTGQDLLRAGGSDQVSVRAWQVLSRAELRQRSWVCLAGGVLFPDREQLRQLVLAGIPGTWSGYVTTSRKKHGSLRAPVNRDGSQRWLYELEVVDCTDREQVGTWWAQLTAMHAAGIPRPVLEHLDIPLPLLAAHRDTWPAFVAWARPRHQSALYRFLTHLL